MTGAASGGPARRIFVYGSLMRGAPAHDRLFRGRPVRATRARMAGRLFALPCGTPVAVEGEGCVRGELLEFEDGSILDDLNRYEGAGADAAALYARVERTVTLPDGSAVSALVWMASDPARVAREGIPLPDGDAVAGPPALG